MIKKTALLTVLLLAVPLAAFASASVDFANRNGTLSGTNRNLALAGSSSTTLRPAIDSGHGFFNWQTGASSDDSNTSTTVLEPSTLGLLGAGLFAVAGFVRRKVRLVEPRRRGRCRSLLAELSKPSRVVL